MMFTTGEKKTYTLPTNKHEQDKYKLAFIKEDLDMCHALMMDMQHKLMSDATNYTGAQSNLRVVDEVIRFNSYETLINPEGKKKTMATWIQQAIGIAELAIKNGIEEAETKNAAAIAAAQAKDNRRAISDAVSASTSELANINERLRNALNTATETRTATDPDATRPQNAEENTATAGGQQAAEVRAAPNISEHTDRNEETDQGTGLTEDEKKMFREFNIPFPSIPVALAHKFASDPEARRMHIHHIWSANLSIRYKRQTGMEVTPNESRVLALSQPAPAPSAGTTENASTFAAMVRRTPPKNNTGSSNNNGTN